MGLLMRVAGRVGLAVCVAAWLCAQTASTITGRVLDGTGAVLAGAELTLRHVDTGMSRAGRSGDDGRFVFPTLPVGAYELRAARDGFRPLLHKGIHLAVGQTLAVELGMELGGLNQELTVYAPPSLVNTQTSELSYLVSESAIRELPLNGRNYTDLALLQPGVVSFPHRDGGSVVAHGLGASINGQDPRSNVYLLDGTPQNDFTNGPAGSAAATVLGLETIREFRVEVNAYSAEFGRNSGGQINALTKSGTNALHGSLYEFHRNDNLDAPNYFDLDKPEFKRNQFGGTVGGPLRADRTFFFAGYEALRERKGRTIRTIVPDADVRGGAVAAVRPYLDEIPLPNGEKILNPDGRPSGLANHSFGFKERLTQDFFQGRVDHNLGPNDQFFARYTIDDAGQRLPLDFPQFPRSFLSKNQFATAEYRRVFSPRTLNTFRVGFSRTRVGQDVEANISRPLAPFVPGRDKIGNIDIGGMPRFGPQTSVNVKLIQNVFSFDEGLVHVRGRHMLKMGALAERYRDNLFNPTFGLGIFTFTNVAEFLANQPARFLGLAPNGALDRYWRFTLFGFYLQDDVRVHPRLKLNVGLRYEFATQPKDIYGRDSALINLTDPAPTVGQLYKNPTKKNLSPRFGFAWDPLGGEKMSVRGGYGLYFNTNNQQNLIVTITNPPATPRVSIARPAVSFPSPPFERGLGNTIRPVEWNIKNPNVHVWNLSVQRRLWADTALTFGYAGARGIHLLRSGDVNTPAPQRREDGTLFFPLNAPRPNPAFTTIELKRSDGNSWYHAMIFEVRKRWSHGFAAQSAYTFSRNIDTTQASTFFSDATNGTTSAFPEFPGFNYNKGLADYHAKHNWVANFTWELPWAKATKGAAGQVLGGWQLGGIWQARSGNPLTVFVPANVSRSLWAPSLGPNLGFDRPNVEPGRTHQNAILGLPTRYFDPTAFRAPDAGTLGNLGRGALIGPNLRNLDLSVAKNFRWPWWSEDARLQFRCETFNALDRANFGAPVLAVGGSLGIIRSTVTSSRQIQFGLRLSF